MKTVGEIAAIWRYPVKSLAPEALQSAQVERGGIPGDRGRALWVEQGHARAGNTYRGKEHNLLHLTHDANYAVGLAAQRDVQVRVVDEEPHYFDSEEISLLFDRWLDEASVLVGYELDPLRYRPNFFASAGPDFLGRESTFNGVTLRIGDCVLRAEAPIHRCVTTTYDQTTGESDPNVLRVVAQERDNEMGIYCSVIEPGTVRIGDAIRVV